MMININIKGIETITGITRSQGLEGGLFGSYEAGKLDETKKIEVTGDKQEWLEKLLEKYQEVLENKNYSIPSAYIDMVFSGIKDNVSNVLEPQQINYFLQATRLYEEHREYSRCTGLFISALIQNSYNAGHNNFILNTQNLKTICYLGAFVEGREKKPLKIKIQSNAGDQCGWKAAYSNFIINGNAEKYCGWFAKHSNFIVNGSTDWFVGWHAEHSTFFITGNTGYAGVHASNCVFSTSNGETLQRMLEYIGQNDRTNKVIFINPDGSKKVVRGFNVMH